MPHSRLNTSLLAIVSCLLWSTAFAGVKIGLAHTSPLQFAGIRFFLSGVLVFPLTYRINPSYFSIVRRNAGLILGIAALQTFLQNLLFYTGIERIPGAVAAMVIGSQPLFVATMAHFMLREERFTPVRILSIVLGIAGVVLVSLGRDPASATGRIALLGVLLVLGVNVQSGFSNVLVARRSENIPPLVLSSASMLSGGAALFLLSLPVEGFHPHPKPIEYYASLAWLSMLSAVAISIWITLLKRPGVKVADLNLWKFLIPVVGALLSWMLLPDENPDPLTITGMFIISSSLIVHNLMRRKQPISG
ncbi:MAG: DMT family transporter [Bacteroidales bacterium]